MPDTIASSVEAAVGSPATAVRRTATLIWWRRLSQLISLFIMGQWSFYGIFRCPFVVPYVSCQNCPVITCHGRLFHLFWGIWLLLPLSGLLFGRAFCAWACPGGLISQILSRVAPVKVSPVTKRFRNRFVGHLPHLAYVTLLLALVVWLAWGQPRIAIPIRVGDFFSSVRLTFQHADGWWLTRSLLVIGLLLMSLVVANLWCRFACPTGGLLKLLSYFSLFKIYKGDKCDDCNRCLYACDMGCRPAESNCTNCGDCLGTCPQGAIEIGSGKGGGR